MLTEMPVWERIVAAAGGLLLIYPGLLTDVIGLVVIAIVFALQLMAKKKTPAAA